MTARIYSRQQKANGTHGDWKNGSKISPKQITHMLEDSDPKVRLAAVKKLAGNALALTYVAKNSKYADTKRYAVEELAKMVAKLSDVEALKIVAVDAHEEEDQYAAVAKLAKNVDALVYVIENSPENTFSDYPVAKLGRMIDSLSDVKALKVVASRGWKGNAWRAAIEKLSGNVDALKDVALSTRYEMHGRAAIDKIDDVDALKCIAEPPKNRELIPNYTAINDYAIWKLVGMIPELSDPDALRVIAVYYRDKNGRLAALTMLDDPDMLTVVAKKSEFKDTRLAAAAKAQPTDFQNGLFEVLVTTQTE
jgi:hypothetical protein